MIESPRRKGFLIPMNEDNPLYGKSLVEIWMMDKSPGYGLESRRWIILISFSLFSSAMLWITFSPISETVMRYYDVGEEGVISLSNSYMYLYILFSFLGSWLASKYFSASLLAAMFINLFGAWVRYFAQASFTIVLIGQYCCAIAQNVILFVPVHLLVLADLWFPPSENLTAISIGTLSNTLGWGVGFMLPTIMISQNPDGLPDVLFWEAIIASVPFLIGIFCIKERPKIPPSFSALGKLVKHTSFLDDTKAALRNKSYLLTALCFANFILVLGQAYTLSSVIVLFLEDLSIIWQGVIGFVFILAAIISGLYGTYTMAKSPSGNYDNLLRIFMHISMLGLIALVITVKYKYFYLIGILNSLLGIGLLGSQPFVCQSLSESTYPVQESIAVNFMIVMAQLFGVIGNYFTTAPWIGSNGLYSQIILILPCWIYVTFFFKTTFRKREAEKLSLEKVEASIIGKKKGDASGLLLPVDEGLLQERLLN